MDEKKEGSCGPDCKCGCQSRGKCCGKAGTAALALVLLLIGGIIGYGAGKCQKMCPMMASHSSMPAGAPAK